ncbi:MAG: alpha/beta hydrolase [Rhodospirillaceae bacterium]|jgi:pimeloyl-ACP methyl ester carboxylesterase
MNITRRFLTLPDGNQVHFRTAGRGPAMILMHPSPISSAALIPAVTAFSEKFTCIALDTPGYGLSDDFVTDKIDLIGYADAVAQILDALNLESAVIYGAATGAQIGTQFACRYPKRTRLLILDGAGHFTDEDRAQFADGYFVDITPRRDGTHLLAAWDASRHLSVFFPWMSNRLDQRVQADTQSPEAIQLHVDDMLRAGPKYKEAYWEAMRYEDHSATVKVKVPTLLSYNAGSMMRSHTEALINKGLPDNFTVVPCDPKTRYTALLTAAADFASKSPYINFPAQTDRASTIQNMMVDVPGGQLRARVCLEGEGLPLMAIHDPAGSSLLVEPMLKPYVGRRPVIAFDNPGNGESDAAIDIVDSENYAKVLHAALDSLGINQLDVIGRYSGGPVAMEMSFQKPQRIRHVVQAGVSLYEGEEQARLIENYTPSVAPRWDGRHLMTAWSVMRDQSLYWPWFNQTKEGIIWEDGAIDVAMTDLRTRELLKCGDRYQDAYNAMWRYPMREKLPKLQVPCLLCHPSWEPMGYTTALAQAIDPRCLSAELPPAMADWHASLDAFFDAS